MYNKTIFDAIIEKMKDEEITHYSCSREFERKITEIAKALSTQKDEISKYRKCLEEIDSITDCSIEERNNCFVCFFILFTYYRRESMLDSFNDLYKKHIKDFEIFYPICEHIKNLYSLNFYKNDDDLFKTLLSSQKLATEKDAGFDFTSHAGILHLFADTCARYYERNIDQKDDSDSKEIIETAIECVNKAIKIEDYSKYYATKGRLCALSKKYDNAERNIKKAITIESEKENKDEHRIYEFEGHLTMLAIVRAHDITNEKVLELNKLKMDNYKTISLTTALLAFLLGAISIFAKLTNPIQIVLILLAYAGLLFVLLGTFLIALSLAAGKGKIRMKYIIFEISILAIGVLAFVCSLVAINYIG